MEHNNVDVIGLLRVHVHITMAHTFVACLIQPPQRDPDEAIDACLWLEVTGSEVPATPRTEASVM